MRGEGAFLVVVSIAVQFCIVVASSEREYKVESTGLRAIISPPSTYSLLL